VRSDWTVLSQASSRYAIYTFLKAELDLRD
jgi:hypothetical protein